MQRDLDGIRLHAHDLTDLAYGQVGAVPESNQLAVALAQCEHGAVKVDPDRRLRLERSPCCFLRQIRDGDGLRNAAVADLTARDADQPRCRIGPAGVEAIAVALGPFDRGRGDVLGINAVADPVCDIRVDAADHWFWIGERVALEHAITLMSWGLMERTGGRFDDR